ncbi:MAG TPA: hypothetical protein VMY39_03815 [Planctomycetota bacterium]|nr:hypothetical protein [Planctomycetota bacterium]
MRRVACMLLLVLSASAAGGQDFEVFQDLDEATSRIPRYEPKPYKTLIDAHDGFFQSEVIIFRDVETGREVWSLSREACTDMAHTGRRPAWSANGRYISFRGNQAFWSFADKAIRKRTWAGYSFVANADGSKKRPIWAEVDGKLRQFNCAKYNMWDVERPGTWYTITGDVLWRITLADGLTDNRAEPIFTFPNAQGKVIQEISDEDFMLVEESGQKPNCYVIDLNRDPADAKFCMTYPLKGEIHSGSFRFKRSRRVVTGGYETRRGLTGGECLAFDEGVLKPTTLEIHLTEGVAMQHLWYGPPDDRVGYHGKYNGKMGLWLQMPGKVPVLMANVPDGHVTWCGRDPEWFFAAVGPGRTPDAQYARRLLAGNADGKTVEIVCTPFDRRRPGPTDYGSIPLPTQSRDGNKCWFHSSMLLADNKYTGSFIAVHRRPGPPVALDLAPGAKGVALRWTPHPINFEVKGYHVYRSGDGGKTWIEMTNAAVAGNTFVDALTDPDRTYLYVVTAEEWSRLESDLTSPALLVTLTDAGAKVLARGASIRGWDKTPPMPAADFKVSRRDDGLIALEWSRNTDKDFRYYNIYASSTGRPEVSQKRLLVSPPHDETLYLDWTAPADVKMYYAITAVDRQGNASVPAYASLE